MTTRLPSDDDATPNLNQVEEMASLLESQHGALAADVADFLSTKHSIKDNTGRCWAWAGVAERVRMRTRQRIENSGASWM